MSWLQRLILAIVPARWRASMIAESMAWHVRCLTCGLSRSYWELGGIRWKAASYGKRVMVRCPQCGRRRWCAVEYVSPDATEKAKTD